MMSPMRARSPHEPHRVSTPLELFFDLVFVVAIAQAAGGFHHAITEGHAAQGVVSFLMVFFAIWWAWMNFTWFASAYDPGDIPYKLAVLVQITGALIVAAGIPAMFEAHAPNGATVGGYVVMRLAMVGQWLRAAASDPERRTTALRFAGGITIVQIAWVAVLFLPAHLVLPAFVAFTIAELCVPAWAERAAPTTWHPHHITERYGLFTIIVLGESILAATVAVQAALASGERLYALAPVIVGGLLTVYSLWWLYFYRPLHDRLADRKLTTAIAWGYGHFVVFVSAAAVGAGLAASVDQATAHAAITSRAAGAAVAIPVALYVCTLWLLHRRPGSAAYTSLVPVSLVLLLLAPLSPQPVLTIGVVLAALLAGKLALQPDDSSGHHAT
jgi:low temperature requirement protein LtrA